MKRETTLNFFFTLKSINNIREHDNTKPDHRKSQIILKGRKNEGSFKVNILFLRKSLCLESQGLSSSTHAFMDYPRNREERIEMTCVNSLRCKLGIAIVVSACGFFFGYLFVFCCCCCFEVMPTFQ